MFSFANFNLTLGYIQLCLPETISFPKRHPPAHTDRSFQRHRYHHSRKPKNYFFQWIQKQLCFIKKTFVLIHILLQVHHDGSHFPIEPSTSLSSTWSSLATASLHHRFLSVDVRSCRKIVGTIIIQPRLAQVPENPSNLTWSRILPSKCKCWDSNLRKLNFLFK